MIQLRSETRCRTEGVLYIHVSVCLVSVGSKFLVLLQPETGRRTEGVSVWFLLCV